MSGQTLALLLAVVFMAGVVTGQVVMYLAGRYERRHARRRWTR